ncbi:quinon protein alcohol dehydrogenase-like superfamily [Suillus paluster]|uniref:quinon protein alcohol dehydrogenase-like superfamily n=1 Tax=Suillus paluster TaxID=48578 RepID=UPI001B85D9CB|nr:quinon protein alcohol dehydrogenase-like superfamily [Suillus paluster]KAG1752441.1 quinon protein alcohol dehydrogenase-like superfamily [Suillus paluster]
MQKGRVSRYSHTYTYKKEGASDAHIFNQADPSPLPQVARLLTISFCTDCRRSCTTFDTIHVRPYYQHTKRPHQRYFEHLLIKSCPYLLTSLAETPAMASRSIQPAAAAKKSILTPVLTLEGHKDNVPSISYFPDGKQIISGSLDKTVRRWDLQAGKEIEEARHFCEQDVRVVAVSRDGQWVVTAGGDDDHGELKAYEVETGIVKTFQGHSKRITCIDISMDSTLLASGSDDHGVRIWSLHTGKLVAGPFKSGFILATTGAVRFSQDSKKLAVASSIVAKCLDVWDVEAQELDVSVGKSHSGGVTFAPIFWTTKDKTIVAAFSFTDDSDAKTIYEFDASTLETVRAPFEGHKTTITGLALSFDCALLASASNDNTIKLWAFESRQLLASFHGQNPNHPIYGQSPNRIVLSPDSRQLAYTTYTGNKIHICDTPPEILASICAQKANASTPKDPRLANLLNSDATRHAVRRNPATPSVRRPGPRPQRQLSTVDPHQSAFLRYLRKLLHSSESRINAVPPVLNDQPRNLLDVCLLYLFAPQLT